MFQFIIMSCLRHFFLFFLSCLFYNYFIPSGFSFLRKIISNCNADFSLRTEILSLTCNADFILRINITYLIKNKGEHLARLVCGIKNSVILFLNSYIFFLINFLEFSCFTIFPYTFVISITNN